MNSVIQIDGGFGEGGGQIIRTCLSLSALTGTPVEIDRVRANRSKPGLQPQHLTAVRAAARICGAELSGAVVGSPRFRFAPSTPVQPGHYTFDIGTAGASTLVLQTVLLPLALTLDKSRVIVAGGTHVPHAPAAEYLRHVYIEVLRAHGLVASVETTAAGFYPRGGGRIEATVEPSNTRAFDLVERGRLRGLTVYLVTSGLPDHVAERGEAAAAKGLAGFKKPDVVKVDLPSNGPGAAVVITAGCEQARAAFSSIGERGKPMERVVDEACRQFAEWYRSGAACDEHLAD